MMRLVPVLLLLLSASPGFAGSSVEYIRDHALRLPASGPWPREAVAALGRARVIFLGEIHGTNEAPAQAAGILRGLLKEGRRPSLALEIWASEQGHIDAFLRTGDVSHLERSAFFDGSLRDGRSSRAMVRLLRAARRLNLPVICFDPAGSDTKLTEQERNTGMAVHLKNALLALPGRPAVVLTGNLHSRVTAGSPFNPALRPAAYELARVPGTPVDEEEILALLVRYEKGSAWYCLQSGCGVYAFGPVPSPYSEALPWESYLVAEPAGAGGHEGAVFIRHVTASLPWR